LWQGWLEAIEEFRREGDEIKTLLLALVAILAEDLGLIAAKARLVKEEAIFKSW